MTKTHNECKCLEGIIKIWKTHEEHVLKGKEEGTTLKCHYFNEEGTIEIGCFYRGNGRCYMCEGSMPYNGILV